MSKVGGGRERVLAEQGILKVSAYVVVGFVAIAALILTISLHGDPEKLFQGLASVSSFGVTLLTATYVLSSTRQMSLLQLQLGEMEAARELISQPLPNLKARIRLERPSAFHEPLGPITILSRLFADFEVRNIGTGPALRVDIKPTLSVKYGGAEYHEIGNSSRVEVLAEGEEAKDCGAMFNADTDYLVLKSLSEGIPEQLPVLTVAVYYQNFVGTPFRADYKFLIYPGDGLVQKRWYQSAAKLNIDLADLIEQSRRIHDGSMHYRIFEAAANRAEETMKDIGKEEMEISAILPAGCFSLTHISAEEYNQAVSQSRYSHILPVVYSEQLEEEDSRS